MPTKVTKQLQKVQKVHAARFAPDEQLLSSCAVVPATEVQLSGAAMFFGLLGALVAHGIDKNKIKARIHDVQLATGTLNAPFSELPKSKNGYTFVLTNKRVVVFDGRAKTYMTECDVTGAQLTVVRHSSGLISLALLDGVEVVAVTARRQSEAMAEHFAAYYPNRREQGPHPVGAGLPVGAGVPVSAGVIEF